MCSEFRLFFRQYLRFRDWCDWLSLSFMSNPSNNLTFYSFTLTMPAHTKKILISFSLVILVFLFIAAFSSQADSPTGLSFLERFLSFFKGSEEIPPAPSLSKFTLAVSQEQILLTEVTNTNTFILTPQATSNLQTSTPLVSSSFTSKPLTHPLSFILENKILSTTPSQSTLLSSTYPSTTTSSQEGNSQFSVEQEQSSASSSEENLPAPSEQQQSNTSPETSSPPNWNRHHRTTCTSQWNCQLTPCVHSQQQLQCTDLAGCEPPTSENKICSQETSTITPLGIVEKTPSQTPSKSSAQQEIPLQKTPTKNKKQNAFSIPLIISSLLILFILVPTSIWYFLRRNKI